MGGILSILIQFFPPRATWSVDEIDDLSGKVFIVTGAGSGIGNACATVLAAKGGKVYVTCRSEEHAHSITQNIRHVSRSDNVHSILMDLSSIKSIKEGTKLFLSQEKELHALFNNAGVMAPSETFTSKGVEMTFATNVLGAFYFTHLLIPALRLGAQSSMDGTSRVVNTSSSTAEIATLNYRSLDAGPQHIKRGAQALYAQSKLGVAIFSRELARRYTGDGIVSTSVHPGSIASKLFRNQPAFIQWLFNILLYTPEQGALTLLYCGLAPEAKAASGKYFIPWARPGKKWQPQPCVEDPAVGSRLWEWLEEHTKI